MQTKDPIEQTKTDAQSTSSPEEYSKKISYATNIVKETAKIGLTGGTVAMSLITFDAILHNMQVESIPLANNNVRSSLFGSAAKFIIRLSAALPRSAMASSQKCAVNGQREKTNEFFEGTSKKDENSEQNVATKSGLLPSIATATTLGVLDTSITQKNTNYKTWNLENARNPSFAVPNPQTLQQRINVYKVGYPIRLTRNIAMIGGFILQPTLQNIAKEKLPAGTSPDVTSLIASGTCGILTGALGNMFDVIYKNQAIRVNPNTITAPRAYDVVKEIGLKPLKRGLALSIVYAAVVQEVLPRAEKFAQKAVDKLETGIKSISASFFKEAPKELSATKQNQPANVVVETISHSI